VPLSGPRALSKLAEQVDGSYRIVSQPPIVVPARDLAATYGLSPEQVVPVLREQFRAYRGHPARRPAAPAGAVRDRGHGPQGRRRRQRRDPGAHRAAAGPRRTRLLQGRDVQDPLFLQIKEATASVLEPYVGKSRYRQHGERVVQGQRMMQAASDIYLGWTKGLDVRRHFYWRQLRDMKGSAVVEAMIPLALTFYARTCGWTLARAHARSGDPVAIAEYLGASDAFDTSITDFSQRYADQNEKDHTEFVQAVRSGGWKRPRASDDPAGLAAAHRRGEVARRDEDRLVLQRHLGDGIAASLVVAGPGLVLASPPPVGPGPGVFGGRAGSAG
jgi:hypothetical protein